MSEYNTECNDMLSKGSMEYTKQEALKRYGKIRGHLYKAISTEEAVNSVKKKLERLKGTDIILSEIIAEKPVAETDTDKEDVSFVGMSELNMSSLFTLPTEENTELSSKPKSPPQKKAEESGEKYSLQRTKKLVVFDSDDEISRMSENSETDEDEVLTSDDLTEEISKDITEHPETVNKSVNTDENKYEEEKVENIGLDFNPSGIKKVKRTQGFKWPN